MRINESPGTSNGQMGNSPSLLLPFVASGRTNFRASSQTIRSRERELTTLVCSKIPSGWMNFREILDNVDIFLDQSPSNCWLPTGSQPGPRPLAPFSISFHFRCFLDRLPTDRPIHFRRQRADPSLMSTPRRLIKTACRANMTWPTMYSAVQINMVNGWVSVVSVHATFDTVYFDSRVLPTHCCSVECRTYTAKRKKHT